MTDEQRNALIRTRTEAATQMWAEAVTKMEELDEIKKAVIEIIDHIRPDGFMYMFTDDERARLERIKARLMYIEEAADESV